MTTVDMDALESAWSEQIGLVVDASAQAILHAPSDRLQHAKRALRAYNDWAAATPDPDGAFAALVLTLAELAAESSDGDAITRQRNKLTNETAEPAGTAGTAATAAEANDLALRMVAAHIGTDAYAKRDHADEQALAAYRASTPRTRWLAAVVLTCLAGASYLATSYRDGLLPPDEGAIYLLHRIQLQLEEEGK